MVMSAKFTMRGKTALITGAGMGMGRLYALRAAREGAAVVILWDVNAENLEKVAVEVVRQGAQAVVQQLDLSNLEAIKSAAAELQRDHGISAPQLLVNNAGIVKGGPFWEHDPAQDISKIMDVNALAPMYVTSQFLPAMMAAAQPARILNIASAAATLANPNMSVYAASKWAVLGWSDSLRLELERAHSPIAVTTFCPSYISTGMFEGAKGPLLTPILSPEVAVERAWAAMLAATPIRLTPWSARLAVALRGVLPTPAWDFVAGNVFKVYNSMDNFTGRVTRGAGKE